MDGIAIRCAEPWIADLDHVPQVPAGSDGLPFFLADFRASAPAAGDGGPAGGVEGTGGGDGGALPVCPRGLLKKVVEQAKQEGFTAFFSQEFEWFNFIAGSADPDPVKRSFRDLKPMTQGMFGYSVLRASQGSPYFHALFDGLKKFGVPLEGLHTETGPGVYEAAISYSDVVEAADRAVLFKAGVKEIAYRHGILPSFMAKVSETLPGCSGHVHQSLWTADGSRNLFYDAGTNRGLSPPDGKLYGRAALLFTFYPADGGAYGEQL